MEMGHVRWYRGAVELAAERKRAGLTSKNKHLRTEIDKFQVKIKSLYVFLIPLVDRLFFLLRRTSQSLTTAVGSKAAPARSLIRPMQHTQRLAQVRMEA